MWAYYDRRVAYRKPGPQNVLNYFRGLGVNADLAAINAELDQVCLCLGELPSEDFVDLGAGPSGEFTGRLAGHGLTLDQSLGALQRLRRVLPAVALVRADATRIPLRDKGVGRVFMAHLYGLLLPDERAALLSEACRVGREIVILDSGRPTGVRAEEWQTRTLPDGSEYSIFRRHFDINALIDEVGGEALFSGQYFVMIRRVVE
jgi:hypothetical protein